MKFPIRTRAYTVTCLTPTQLQELQIYNYTSAAIRDVPDQWSTLTRLSTLGLSFQHTHVT